MRGDPASDPDPDGTIADMGAYYYDQNTQPPEAPVELDYIAGVSSVTVTWSPNTEVDLTHYVVYHSIDQVNFDSLTSVFAPDTSYTDNTADLSEINYYKIAAVDTANLKSGYSETLIISYPIIAASDDAVGFGGVNVVDLVQKGLTLYNNGSNTLMVDSIYISGGEVNYFGVEIGSGKGKIAGSPAGGGIFASLRQEAGHRQQLSSNKYPSVVASSPRGRQVSSFKNQEPRTNLPDYPPDQVIRAGVSQAGNQQIKDDRREAKEKVTGGSKQLAEGSRQLAKVKSRKPKAESRDLRTNLTNHASRITHHVSRITHYVFPGDSLELILTFAPQDTGDFTDVLVVFSDDPTGNDSLTVDLSGTGIAPLIATDSDSIDFQQVRQDSAVFVSFPLFNPGTDTLHITDVTLNTTVFEANVAFEVEPGGSVELTVGFTPDGEGTFLDTLRILSDAYEEAIHEIRLYGEGVKPTIDVVVSELQFGNVRRDSSYTLSFDISNTGTDLLTISEIFSSDFAIFKPAMNSTAIDQDSLKSVEVTFTPVDSVFYQGTLTLVHDDPDQGDITINLQGQGVVPVIETSEVELAFGSVRVNGDSTIMMTIANTGNDTLKIDTVYTSNPLFTVSLEGGSGVLGLSGGHSSVTNMSLLSRTFGSMGTALSADRRVQTSKVGTSSRKALLLERSRPLIENVEKLPSVRSTLTGLPHQTSKRSPSRELRQSSGPLSFKTTVPATPTLRVPARPAGGRGLLPPGRDPTATANFTQIAPGETLDLFVTFAPGDTGNVSAMLTILTDDPEQQQSDISLSARGVAPSLTLSDESYDFGMVTVDSSSSKVFTLSNTGEYELVVSDLSLSNIDHFSIEPATVSPIPPGGDVNITVTFTPDTTETYSAVLTVTSDDLFNPTQTIDLDGSGIASRIELTQTTLHFGNVGDSTIFVTVSNAGTEALQILDITQPEVSNFVLSFAEGDLPISILPSETATLQANFQSTESGHYTGTAILHTNAFMMNDVSIDLEAFFLTSQTVDFGRVLINRDSTIFAFLHNNGNEILDIENIFVTTEEFEASIILEAEVLPNDSFRVELLFTPGRQAVFADSVEMTFTGLSDTVTMFSISGEGITYPERAYNSNSFGITTVKGTDVSFDLVISNRGDYPLDYSILVDATWVTYDWLDVSTLSGQVSGNSANSLTVSVLQTVNLEVDTYEGWLYITTNSGTDLTDVTDTVTVDLNLLSDSEDIASGNADIPSGNAPPVEIRDEGGNSLGITFDFVAGNGGSINVTLIPSTPPTDTTTTINDPDGLITNPVFSNFYWEVFSDIPEGFVVDIIFSYAGLAGIQNPEKLRLARRSNYAGMGVIWDFLSSSSDTVEVDAQNKTITAKNQREFSQWTIASNAGDNSFEDTQAPTITNIMLSPASPSMLDDVAVSAAISDESGVLSVSLFYIKGGSTSFTETSMTDDGSGTYSGTIPGASVTVTGLAYFLRAQDVNGFSVDSDTLSVQVTFPASSLSTGVSGSAFSSGFPMNKWRLISVPADLDDNTVLNTIGDEFGGSPSNTTWQASRWTGSSWTDATQFAQGESYWLYQMVADNVSFGTGAGKSVDLMGTTLILDPGWNLISSPYAFKVNVTADQGTFYGPLTYGNGSEGWSDVLNQLSPWGGYILYNRTGSSKTLDIVPVNGGGSILAKSTVDEIEGWKLKLSVHGKTYSDEANYIGRIAGAEEMLDHFDNPEPPYIDGFVSLAMSRPDWGTGLPKFTSDIRSLEEINGVWDIDLHVKDESGPITMTPKLQGELPGDIQVILLDLMTRKTHDLIMAAPGIIITEYREAFPYHFKVISGSPDYVSRTVHEILTLLPEQVTLSQNYPNPFNPTTRIQFALPKPARVALKIYNLLGQEVVTLTEGWKDLGYHEVTWNGKDQFGREVASGMYFSVLNAGNRVVTRKMVLLR
ncbi:MAG: choice-of-anchor D domain-containing protein [Candidatus Marinimicrobia bacterium]|nr:choice-of-anchor D domain-containing protein [Candidatus Neomarinimicrobiota bacterium]